MTDRLKGKRIAITGAVENIGRAAVEAFLAEGARVAVADLNEKAGKALQEMSGGSLRFFKCDVSDAAQLKAFIDDGAKVLGGLDVLCQNAGLQRVGDIADFAIEDWDALFGVNVRSQFLGAKFALPYLKASGKGSIVNMASVAGVKGIAGAAGYCASKGACVLLTYTMAKEFGRFNIRANAICPGWVDTPFNNPIIGYLGGRPAQDEAVKRDVPLGRQSTPAEIAPLYVYLASDESSFVSGQSIVVDGGTFRS
jgi:NAD(P)-dependent dehydrogenase (short-subunit alcohol dehydrogenase family)